jgi:secernin
VPGTFGVADMMKILRDEDSGINMGGGTCGSQVSLLPSNTTASSHTSPCCHWFTATPSPDASLFKPFIFGPNPSVGSLAVSPDYGDKDPRVIKPRFQSKVERRHELFKGHEKLQSLLIHDEVKANKIIQNLKDLESNCIGDMEEILKNFDESSFAKVSNLFDHMCNIELNFYKDA